MIKTIQGIANVGKIANYSGGENVAFRKLTLIYGANGQGKTTLVDILRSLRAGDGNYIMARRTLGAKGAPEVSILLETGTATFHDGRWDKAVANIEIFDDTFIRENVYAGDLVDVGHRRNLYRVMVGEEGVKLARKVDELLEASHETARESKKARECVEAHLPDGWDLKDFLDLSSPPADLDKKITELQGTLIALQRQREINEKGVLKKILLPTVPEQFFEVLAKELSDVSKNAEQAMRDHMRQCGMDERGEIWLEQGLEYAQTELCPFCEQKLTGNVLIESYQGFFGESYRNLKSEIDNQRNEMEKRFGEQARLQLEGDVSENRVLCPFWHQFVALNLPELPYDELQRAWHDLRTATQKHLDRKRASPLERVSPDQNLEAAHKEWNRLLSVVKPFNEAVDDANGLIAKKKHEIDNASLENVTQTLDKLRAVKIRHSPKVLKVCREYQEALQNREKVEEDRQQARNNLDEYTKNIISRYQARITELLKGYKTGFVIGQMWTGFGGGLPNASYEIVINKTAVKLGNEKTLAAIPCFKNTLSSGDRSSLALSFFLARLHQDPRVAEKIIVFDDPMTSQDDFRSAYTQKLIGGLNAKSKQLVVLSHDPRFLRGIRGMVAGSDVSTLKISTGADDRSTVEKWDLDGTT